MTAPGVIVADCGRQPQKLVGVIKQVRFESGPPKAHTFCTLVTPSRDGGMTAPADRDARGPAAVAREGANAAL